MRAHPAFQELSNLVSPKSVTLVALMVALPACDLMKKPDPATLDAGAPVATAAPTAPATTAPPATALPTGTVPSVPTLTPTPAQGGQPGTQPKPVATGDGGAATAAAGGDAGRPSIIPTALPSGFPTALPSGFPTALPSTLPSAFPTALPSGFPPFTLPGQDAGKK